MGASKVSIWLEALWDHNALAVRMLSPEVTSPDLTAINETPHMVATAELADLFATVTGYDRRAVDREKAKYTGPPQLVNEMELYPDHGPIEAKDLAEEIELRDVMELSFDDQSYLGIGFVPFGQTYNGEFLYVNANPESPTFNAIYELYEGIGSSRIANSLPEYFLGLATMLEIGGLRIDEWGRIDYDSDKLQHHWAREVGTSPSKNGQCDW